VEFLPGGHKSEPSTFKLCAPNYTTVFDTETIAPSGDGTYTTSNTHFAMQVGRYTWKVTYAGGGLNNGKADQGGAAEQVTVGASIISGTILLDVTGRTNFRSLGDVKRLVSKMARGLPCAGGWTHSSNISCVARSNDRQRAWPQFSPRLV
jgi:hypothetical protein